MSTETQAGTTIVVGFDGSPDAIRALRAGVDLGRRRGAPVQVLVARGDFWKASSWADSWTRGLAEEWLETARVVLAEEHAEAELVIRDGNASEVLVEAGESARMLVVGAQGHNQVFVAMNGSTSQHVARHATCPVMVVRETRDPRSGRVVVGVDGSDASMRALDVAGELARDEDDELVVVFVAEFWQPGTFAYDDALVAAEIVELRRANEARVLARIEEYHQANPGIRLRVDQPHRSAASALVRASRSARVVVVGARGRGAFAALLLGSVSSSVLHRAHCPVVVTR